jgi:hypothetical protein
MELKEPLEVELDKLDEEDSEPVDDEICELREEASEELSEDDVLARLEDLLEDDPGHAPIVSPCF